jgi:hypothetical protein
MHTTSMCIGADAGIKEQCCSPYTGWIVLGYEALCARALFQMSWGNVQRDNDCVE